MLSQIQVRLKISSVKIKEFSTLLSYLAKFFENCALTNTLRRTDACGTWARNAFSCEAAERGMAFAISAREATQIRDACLPDVAKHQNAKGIKAAPRWLAEKCASTCLAR